MRFVLAEKIEKLRKEEICKTKMMCHDDSSHPVPCLYDEPDGDESCSMQNKKIPKEKCDNYKEYVYEYENYDQYNFALDDILKEAVEIEEEDIYRLLLLNTDCWTTTKRIYELFQGDK